MNDKAVSAREKIARLRASFLEQLPSKVSLARGHFRRLLADPSDAAAAAELHRFLHSVKGTGRSFGFQEIGALAARGEALAAVLLEPGQPAGSTVWQKPLAACLEDLTRVAASLGTVEAEGGEMPVFALPEAGGGTRGEGSRLVYLCDDDAPQVEQLAAQLGCFGYDTVAFTDPLSLHEAVLARRPDAVVMDIHFPEGHSAGIDVLADLKRDIGDAIPAIFLSGRDDFEARLRAVQVGGEAYFHKPARAMELVAALDELTEKQRPEPYRILIVDDEPEIASYHRIILQEAGMVTYQLSEPARVLQVLDEFRPDMVLMDVYMPQCSGRDLAKVIRQMPDHVGLPIVFLSSETDRKKQFSAMRVGAEGFLTKPVVPEDLVAAVAIRAERMRTLRSLMARDSLTGLFNHTTTTQLLETAIANARRQLAPLSFAMIDIDRFKSINDTYGHPVGDQVIIALARVLQQRLRGSDIVGRYGGEEFAVIFQETHIQDAAALLDKLRRDFTRVVFHGSEVEFSCTFSAGVASYPEHRRMELLREAADKALYEAKRSGRNRVIVD